MTCREKLKLEHPECACDPNECNCEGGCLNCPDDYEYLDRPDYCGMGTDWRDRCTDCWDREIPGTESVDIPPQRKTKILCISGRARHGKDTTAQFLKEALEHKGKKVLIAHYGDLVKYVCKTFFDWNGEKDEAGRTLLQYIGTDCIRANTPNYWVDFVLSVLKHFPDTWDYVLIPDCRFPNEIDCVKNAGWDTMHVRVVRRGNGFVSPLTEEQQNHISETALDNVRPDFLILNHGTLDYLREYVDLFAGYLEGEI